MAVSMERWVGKTAIVTGASAGIGKAIAETLVEEGVKVVAVARRQERLNELKEKLKAKKGELIPFKADMTKEEDILSFFKWTKDNVGPVHILVNNAGLTRPTNLTEGKTELWKDVFDTNVLGLCIATREAVQNMRANKVDGHIVHINSILGHKVINTPTANVYPASKHAVTALTETLRNELNSFGDKIKISSISPGMVDTEIFNPNNATAETREAVANIPKLEPRDVAEAVKFVISTPPHVQIHELIIKSVGEPF